MAYATIDDMVQRFGAAEMIRATTPDGTDATVVVAPPLQAALDDATATIDGYLRKRYAVPLDVAPAEINRACCMLARYEISLGGERSPSEQTAKEREATLKWLSQVSRGDVLLPLNEMAPTDNSFAAFSGRDPVFSDTIGGCAGNAGTDATFGSWPNMSWSGPL